ncbi:hypothetical protein ABPG74_007813 [Tetrahymena malaccensis]
MQMKTKFVILFILLLINSLCQEEQPKRFIDDEVFNRHSTHDPKGEDAKKFLYIHLIPHSHDDVGWLKTVDQYYYGSENLVQKGGVQYTIDSVVDELLKNSTRKFVQVETAYLYRWWKDSPQNRRDLYTQLVNNGQIEFLNGGWCMNDEAAPYYEDIIDQMTVGHQWLKQQFGEKGIPKIGWHIDPFGHQSTQAALFSQMGFNAWWFARIDYQDKDKRLSEQALEMVWRPQQASGNDNSIFTCVNYNMYNPPPHFDFDVLTNDVPIMDNPELENYNVDKRSVEYINYFRKMSAHYRSNHLLHTQGSDFHFSNALQQYKNLDRLMDYINARSDQFQAKILYSTPSIYLEQIRKQNISYPLKEDDFLPYADKEHAYWTGYFTSRVAVKGNVRDTGRYLQHVRNIFSVNKMNQSSKSLMKNYKLMLSNLDSFEQNMGILQHHDAVAGTERQHVAYDYQYRLQNSTDRINEVLHPMMEEFTERDINENVKYSQCKWNSTADKCSETYKTLNSGKTVLINVYNPSVARSIIVKVKVPNVIFTLINSQNQPIYGEVFCVNETDSTDCDLYFQDSFEGYSYNYYKLVPGSGSNQINMIQGKNVGLLKETEVVNVSDNIMLTINRFQTKFQLQTCQQNKQNCTSNNFEVLYNYYPSYQTLIGQSSGAYIFRPDLKIDDSSIPYSQLQNQVKQNKITKQICFKKFFQQQSVFNGKLATIVLIQGNHTTSQLKVFAHENYKNIVEIETFVDGIPVLKDLRGKEVVLLIKTEISNNQTFYTDSNGLELQKRILNYRPTWELKVHEKVSGNYYPVNGMILIKDINTGKRVSIVNDRSQGASSLHEGEIEVMIHRRLLNDDNRGVTEPLNELEPGKLNSGLTQKVRHYLVFEEGDETMSRKVQSYHDSLPIIFQAESKSNTFERSQVPQAFNPLKSNTDPFLKIVFQPFGENYILRVTNLNDVNSTNYSIPEGIEIVEEVTLTANQNKEQMLKNKFKWNVETEKNPKYSFSHKDLLSSQQQEMSTISLKPLELKAFIVRNNTQKQQFEQY